MKNIKKKLLIEALWNQFIYKKYSKNIKLMKKNKKKYFKSI